MRFRNWTFCAAIAVACLPGTLWAANTVLSGVFDGSEARIAPLPGTCPGAGALGYRAISNVQVTASGSYTLVDAFNLHAGLLRVIIHKTHHPQKIGVARPAEHPDRELAAFAAANHQHPVGFGKCHIIQARCFNSQQLRNLCYRI